jgi:hypothetical protein
MEGLVIFLVFLQILFTGVYIVPLLVAAVRCHPNVVSITIVNLFLGWTFIGWIVALVWAVSHIDGNYNPHDKWKSQWRNP